MNAQTYQTLEYDQFREQLGAWCSNSLGRRRLQALEPATEISEIRARAALGREFQDLLRICSIPLGGIEDIGPLLQDIQHSHEIPEAGDLHLLARFLEAVSRLREFSGDLEREQFPRLLELFAGLFACADLRSRIELCIDANGRITDEASAQLRKIRRDIKIARGRVQRHLERYLKRPEFRDVVVDQLVTVRQDRFVIPLRSNFRGKIDGVVQGHSASGGTFYVEPTEVVEFNNQLASMRAAEREEEYRILRDIDALVRARLDALETNARILGQIDLQVALATYADKCGGSFLEPDSRPGMLLEQLRHPLLGEDAVPVDVRLESPVRALLITGPNTGGKTLAIKAAGLAVLCCNAGIPVLCQEGASRLAFFDSVYADIGDEQSIEQSLSTFSSHVVNIARIAREAGERSLVLLDELGSGTDPEEGAPLGVGILHAFLQRRCHLLATTHLGALKRWAMSEPAVRSAAVAFDLASLQPEYRLLYDRQGESGALLIAERYGLDADIVQRARLFREEQLTEGLRTIESLERQLEGYRKREAEFREQREALESRLQQLDREQRARVAAAQRERDRALEEADRILREVRVESERYRKSMKKSAVASADRERFDQLRRDVGDRAQQVRRGRLEPLMGDPQPGDLVHLERMGKDGRVIAVRGRQVEVDLSGMRVQVKRDQLFAPRDPDRSRAQSSATPQTSEDHGIRSADAKPELKLIGMTRDEAIPELERYLAAVALSSYPRVRIIHGLGTGRLKRAVQEYLRQAGAPWSNFRAGEAHEGGLGATVIELEAGGDE